MGQYKRRVAFEVSTGKYFYYPMWVKNRDFVQIV